MYHTCQGLLQVQNFQTKNRLAINQNQTYGISDILAYMKKSVLKIATSILFLISVS